MCLSGVNFKQQILNSDFCKGNKHGRNIILVFGKYTRTFVIIYRKGFKFVAMKR